MIFAIIVRLYAKVVIHTVQNAPSYVMDVTAAKTVMIYAGIASPPVRDAQTFARAAACVKSAVRGSAPTAANAGSASLNIVRAAATAVIVPQYVLNAENIALNAPIYVKTATFVRCVQRYAHLVI